MMKQKGSSLTRQGQGTSSLWVRVLAASVLILVTACATSLREPGPNELVSEQEEQAQAAQLKRRAARFRWNQQVRLERVLTRLLLAVPDPPHVSVEVAPCDGVNAYVRRGSIHVCLGMLRFVKSDDELAVVLGHEMGHLPTSADRGLLEGGQGEGEREADIRGLLYAHRAGYDIRVGAKVFERMAVELSPGMGDGKLSDHPSHAERIVLAEKMALLVDGKRAEEDAGMSLKHLQQLVGFFTDNP